MKKILLLAVVLVSSPAFPQYYNQPAQASGNGGGMYGQDQQVNGYARSNGSYVEPYHRTARDSNPYNNYSTQGNVNPYTGQVGHKAPGY